MKEKFLGVDFGDARTGLALSEATGLLAVGAGCIRCGNLRKTAEQVAAFAKEQGVARIIIGKPLNMNGTEGPRCEKARELKTLLEERTDREIVLWDERWTTVAAHDILHANGRKEKKHKKVIDAVAASLILEGFLGTRH